jgi:hypothetical protein
MSYNGNPKVEKDFYIFKDAIINNIELSDCNDTVNGICIKTDTVQDCINICKNNNCKNGYFISEKKGGLCIPLIKTEEEFYYRIRNKDIYPELKDKTTYVFSNIKDKYPPEDTNILYYNDNVVIKNLNSNLFLSINDDGSITQQPNFSKEAMLNVQFIQSRNNNIFSGNYIKVKNGDDIIINIPQTAMVLRKDLDTDMVVWKLRASFSNIPANTFQIFALNKSLGDILTYDDNFYFKYQGNIIVFDDTLKNFKVSNLSLTNALQKSNFIFKLIPKIQFYSLKNGTCDKSSSNESTVYRNVNCWGKAEKKNDNINLYILAMVLLLMLFFFNFLFMYRNKLE